MLSAREISQGELPSQSWVNQHLVYTHGYGIIASPTNVAAQDGNPDFLLSGIPVPKDAPITLNQPDLYFGEHQPGYALVDAKQREFDYSRPGRADAEGRRQHKAARLRVVRIGPWWPGDFGTPEPGDRRREAGPRRLIGAARLAQPAPGV